MLLSMRLDQSLRPGSTDVVGLFLFLKAFLGVAGDQRRAQPRFNRLAVRVPNMGSKSDDDQDLVAHLVRASGC